MFLRDLLAGSGHLLVRGDAGAVVAGVTHDSRQVKPGWVFVAVPGFKADGMRFAGDATARGAAAIVVGRGRAGSPELAGAPAVIETDQERAALADLARAFYGRPDETMRVVGVTGTNGKTTTCRILVSILEAAGVGTGHLGTVSYSIGGETLVAERTTPEASDIHRYLAGMREAGCGACVMEVSSQALDLDRVRGMRFAVGVFTNLTRDHLDYHHDMEGYFAAKQALFVGSGAAARSVVNVDDAWGIRLAQSVRSAGGLEPITFGEAKEAAVRIGRMEIGSTGLRLTLEEGGFRAQLGSPLLGRPNAFNVTAAAAAARALGIDWETIGRGVSGADRVEGRMEPVDVALPGGRRQPFGVLVDYAHTDDALRNLLETVRQLTPGRVIVVFGCGGDRDRSKRPLMGAHAARLADVVFVTSDNPRSEPPEAILAEILAGAEAEKRSGGGAGEVHADPDRRAAIEAAIAAARPGDMVVIAGKGHETYQIVGDRIDRFDDRVVAREALERLLGSSAGGPA